MIDLTALLESLEGTLTPLHLATFGQDSQPAAQAQLEAAGAGFLVATLPTTAWKKNDFLVISAVAIDLVPGEGSCVPVSGDDAVRFLKITAAKFGPIPIFIRGSWATERGIQ